MPESVPLTAHLHHRVQWKLTGCCQWLKTLRFLLVAEPLASQLYGQVLALPVCGIYSGSPETSLIWIINQIMVKCRSSTSFQGPLEQKVPRFQRWRNKTLVKMRVGAKRQTKESFNAAPFIPLQSSEIPTETFARLEPLAPYLTPRSR